MKKNKEDLTMENLPLVLTPEDISLWVKISEEEVEKLFEEKKIECIDTTSRRVSSINLLKFLSGESCCVICDSSEDLRPAGVIQQELPKGDEKTKTIGF